MGGVRLPHHFKRLYWPFSWALERGFQTVAVTYIHYTMAYGATAAISIRAVHDMQTTLHAVEMPAQREHVKYCSQPSRHVPNM
jgi:hypothetical protein